MQCPSCQNEIPEGSAFCNRCGAPLSSAGTTAAPSLPASFVDGRYQVERKLGEGGKGIVFLCQDTTLGRKVAIKLIKEEVMDPDSLARFQREVRAMGQLVHPNVVTIHDVGQEGGRHFLVLELMEGGDVEHLIQDSPDGRLDTATVVRVGSDMARGLAHAHSNGILHRDIKPGNAWLTSDGIAKLGDFGLAYLGGGTRLTRAGMMVGTVAYMAPEVALGRQADERSDLYMLGASLYEMATGRVPFQGDDPVRVIFSHINDMPLSPRRLVPDIPPALETLITRLLSKDPEQRPENAGAVLDALESIDVGAIHELHLRGTPPEAVQPTTPEPRWAQPVVGRDREVAA
ncbi:MAG: protein kinase, partial [Chloroflexi bacterium]|nr:protein kinase [Chloroflexota bacterium]